MKKQNPKDSHETGATRIFPSRLDCALRSAARAWAVFPLHWVEGGNCSCATLQCPKAGKHPLTTHGMKDPTTDEAQIRAWWHQHPEANIGVATGGQSGLIVLDIDRNGYLSLQQMEAKYGALPGSPTVRTGDGGQHLYFSSPSGMPIKNRVGLLPGIDVRGDDGYVVGAGSIDLSGKRYLYLSGKTPSQQSIQPCPAWLLDLIGDKRRTKLEAEITIAEGELLPV